MEVRDGYKQSELGLIPFDWSVMPISSIAPLQRGFDLPHRAINSGSYPVVYSNGIEAFHSKFMVKGPGLVTGRSGTLGKVHYVDSDYWPHNTTLWVTRLGSNNAKFIYYLYSDLNFERFASGSGVPTLNRNDVHSFRVAIPSDPREQLAIATALSDVDALIVGLEKLIAKKRDLKQAAMQQLLTGQTRLPGFSGEWALKTLGDIAHIQKGQLITTETMVVGNVPVIAGGKKPAYFHNKPNRLGKTITVSASGASAGYVAFHRSPIFASDCSTISEDKKYCIEFLYFSLQLKQEAIYSAQTGGAQPHIQPKDLSPLPVLLPIALDEQETISKVLCDMDDELKALESRLAKTRDLKQGMMQELLTGRTRLV